MPRRPSSAALRRMLVEELESKGNITDKAVRKALLAVPRERFLPSQDLTEVYADKAIVTRKDGFGRPTSSSSQPAIMASMLERLQLAPGLRVLEIGTGTGYNAALLATLGADVTSIEVQPDLAEAAERSLTDGGYRANVVTGDGREGWPAAALYDRIVLTASTATVCRAWLDQLAPGGLLQLPLHLRGPDLQAVVTLRKEDGALRSTDVVDGGFMELRAPGAAPRPHQGSSVSVSDYVKGKHRSLGSLVGDDLARLGASARTRLAAVLLSEPSVRRLGRAGPRSVYLSLARPTGAVVTHYHRSGLRRLGVAVATRDGRSLAVVAGARLESYGDGRATELLDGLLDQWTARGRPGTGDLRVTVTFPDGGPSRIRFGWPQPSMVRARR